MKMTFIGAGSAFFVNGNYHSNILLESEVGKKLLIDCGSDARHALYELGFSYRDIGSVYISHLHTDHCGGLPWLGLTNKFDSTCQRPTLYLQKDLGPTLWDNVLLGQMRTIGGITAELDTFFDPQLLDANGSFVWEKVTFELVQTIHAPDGFSIIPSYGLFFSYRGKNIFITTDTQFSPDTLGNFYQKSDLIFHDCETRKHKSGVHAHYTELVKLDESIKKKMWLYHYDSAILPDAKKDKFRGFVKKGQVFNLDKADIYK